MGQTELATNPALNIAILGDLNGFYFEEAQTQLTDSGLFTNLQVALLARKSATAICSTAIRSCSTTSSSPSGLLNGAGVDAVHINANFGAARNSDHDPQVARVLLGTAPTDLTLDNASVAENLPAGTVVGTASATDAPGDVLTYCAGRSRRRPVRDRSRDRRDHHPRRARPRGAGLGQPRRPGHRRRWAVASTAPFVIAVTDVNEAPVAVGDPVAVNEDATTANLWSQLLGNDSDPDAGDSLTIISVGTAGTLGSVIFDAATQSLRYVADDDSFDASRAGATATDSFTYTVRDAGGLTSTATVTVTVTGIADGIRIVAGNGNDVVTGTAGEDRLYRRQWQ